MSERWGLLDSDGKQRLPAQFARPHAFHDGLSVANRSPLYGFIDLDGNWVIQPQFVDARPMLGRVAPVAPKGPTKMNKWGLLSRDGSMILEPTYAALEPYGELFKWLGPYRRTTQMTQGYVAPSGEEVWS